MPVTPVACKTRGLDAINGADLAAANHRHKSLEPGPLHAARPRAPEIVVDYGHRCEAHPLRRCRQIILTALAFEVPRDLRHRRLTNIHHRSVAKMVRRDLGAHSPLPSSSSARRRGTPAGDRPMPRPAPWGSAAMGDRDFARREQALTVLWFY